MKFLLVSYQPAEKSWREDGEAEKCVARGRLAEEELADRSFFFEFSSFRKERVRDRPFLIYSDYF